MLVSTLRFVLNGWIHELYLQPDFFFTYYGFDWIQPLGTAGMYGVFAVMGLAALCIMLGWRYRLAAVVFFLSFTYVELIDKTHYLNHYYFVSIIAFLLILVPANRYFSLDVVQNSGLRRRRVPAWTVNIFKLQLGLVYFYAGAAKLNPDWLLTAMPMKIWLAAHTHWPVIGPLLDEPQTAYLFSWAGALFDLSISFLLLYRTTRLPAYMAVITFHLFTYALFQIGMFPFIMILCTLVFFSPSFHKQCLDRLRQLAVRVGVINSEVPAAEQATPNAVSAGAAGRTYTLQGLASKLLGGLLILHFVLQLLLPLRFILYPGNVMWSEQGFRFSWRVMLMEKSGHAVFHLHDADTGRSWEAANWRYLTPRQEKMMAMKPDMMVQYAHHLEEVYRESGIKNVKITAQTHVTLNGRKGRPLIDPFVDLTRVERGWHHKSWILPLNTDNRSWFSTSSL